MEYALITGANRGIGFYLAKEMALDGYNLILVGRNADSLREAKQKLSEYGVSILTLVYDLSDPDAPARIYKDVKEKGVKIGILANNAGFGSFGEFVDNDLTNEINMIDVNISALVKLTHLFANDMKKRKSGKIMNVASVAGFQAGPYMNVYFASKNFVRTFSEALAYELAPYGITVTALCPGSTETDFFDRAQVARRADRFQRKMSPQKVAHIGYEGLKNGKSLVIPGVMNQMAIHVQRFLSRDLVTFILGKSMAKK